MSGRAAISRRASEPFASIVSNATTWRGGSTVSLPVDASPVAVSRSCAWCCGPRSTTPWPQASCAAAQPHASACPDRSRRPDTERDADAWTEDELHRFLIAISGHRWEAPLRLAVLYGLRRSELLAVRWSAVDAKRGTVRIERALVEVRGRPEWSSGKNARSRRTIPIDESMVRALVSHRRFQAEERLAAGHEWVDNDLVVATRTGTPVSPGNFDQTLDRLVAKAGVPRLTSHGLRHTAATHMVRHAGDIGEIRAAADLLGHSPDMLMRTYAHALARICSDRHRQDRPPRDGSARIGSTSMPYADASRRCGPAARGRPRTAAWVSVEQLAVEVLGGVDSPPVTAPVTAEVRSALEAFIGAAAGDGIFDRDIHEARHELAEDDLLAALVVSDPAGRHEPGLRPRRDVDPEPDQRCAGGRAHSGRRIIDVRRWW